MLLPGTLLAQAPGVAPGIPEPDNRNVIVQLFNWKFDDVKAVIPTLKALGYSHVHVSPPQKSNEHVWQWWGRYQPVDYGTIAGPLGSEAAFQQMNAVADANDMNIVVDVVLNHTVDITEQPNPPFIIMSGNFVSSETFPQFDPQHFHERCAVSGPGNEQTCWLSNNLADLKTTDNHVRQVAKDYLVKLANLGADGFRFDAAIHVEPDFYSEVLSAVPGKFAFGEIIKNHPSHFAAWVAIPQMDFYDFPLTKTMREAFAFGGDLRMLKNPKADDKALEGPKAVTFVRNHDVDRGQADDRGLDPGGRQTFGVGWNEDTHSLDRTDVRLAYAYLFGREDGLPYVFTDMNTLPNADQDDRFNDPFVVAGVRFHNLCLAGQDGVGQRQEVWRIETANTIGWQRGTDRFIVINKAGEPYEINNLGTSLQPGAYKEVRTGWPMQVQSGGTVVHWSVPPRSAMMFVRIGS
jgi:alpha-amylase